VYIYGTRERYFERRSAATLVLNVAQHAATGYVKT